MRWRLTLRIASSGDAGDVGRGPTRQHSVRRAQAAAGCLARAALDRREGQGVLLASGIRCRRAGCARSRSCPAARRQRLFGWRVADGTCDLDGRAVRPAVHRLRMGEHAAAVRPDGDLRIANDRVHDLLAPLASGDVHSGASNASPRWLRRNLLRPRRGAARGSSARDRRRGGRDRIVLAGRTARGARHSDARGRVLQRARSSRPVEGHPTRVLPHRARLARPKAGGRCAADLPARRLVRQRGGAAAGSSLSDPRPRSRSARSELGGHVRNDRRRPGRLPVARVHRLAVDVRRKTAPVRSCSEQVAAGRQPAGGHPR